MEDTFTITPPAPPWRVDAEHGQEPEDNGDVDERLPDNPYEDPGDDRARERLRIGAHQANQCHRESNNDEQQEDGTNKSELFADDRKDIVRFCVREP